MEDSSIGQVIDRRYALRREIDRGGIAAVYEAEHLFTGRSVAVKLLNDEQSKNPEARERLLREARALTLARHPNVVTVLDAGKLEGDVPYLVMELIEGRTLAGILAARQRLAVADAVRVAIQLCEALSVIHERGVVHRDIKPSNVFVARDEIGREVVKLFDFGIATFNRTASPIAQKKLTQLGVVIGTPEYMSPEQLIAEGEIDHRADLWAIAVTLYETIAGVVPFEGHFGEVLLKATSQPMPPLRARCPEVSPELEAALARALSKNVAERFSNARELGQTLALTIDGPFVPPAVLGIRRAGPPPLPAHGTGQARPTRGGRGLPKFPSLAPPVVHPGQNGVRVRPSTAPPPQFALASLAPAAVQPSRNALPAVSLRNLPAGAVSPRASIQQLPAVAGTPRASLQQLPAVAGTPRASLQQFPAVAPANKPVQQRRRYPRAPYVTPVRIRQRDGGTLDGRSEDISEGGLLVLADRPCQAEEKVEIRFALPTTGRIVTARAIARWVRTSRGTGAVGLEFEPLPTETRAAIRRYVSAMGGA